MSYAPRLKEQYNTEIVPSLQKEFNYKSIMQVPKLSKIVINQGIGDATSDKRLVDNAVHEMTMYYWSESGSYNSKKDISNFKLRKGMPIGAKVTLRGD